MNLKLVSLFAGHLDLNGDQANLLVAKKRLEWAGHNVELADVPKGGSIPNDADLIFVGHGSIAAWADIESEFRKLIPHLKHAIANGVGFMAVATGHEMAIECGLFEGKITQIDRVSKFEIAQLDGLEVLGYLNSATTAPVIQKKGLVLGTQLHGPVFAKNPELVDSYLLEVAQSRNKSELGNLALNSNADLVAGIVKQVWELERDLACE